MSDNTGNCTQTKAYKPYEKGSEILLLFCTLIIGFYSAWSIGANDVANSMGTVVGSKSLTLKRAVIIAAVFEFMGAFFVGSHVTDTVRKGIIDPSYFALHPQLLAYGMFSALFAAAFFQHGASFLGFPISTTHAIVGAIFGVGLTTMSTETIQWHQMGVISLGWIISPLLGALASFIIFTIIRKIILAKKQPYHAAITYAPFFVALQFTIIALSIIYKGLKNLHLDLPFSLALHISAAVGILSALFTWKIARRKDAPFDQKEQYLKVEKIFGYLQLFTACYIAFAHGANDVANAIGPVAAVYHITSTNTVGMQVTVPLWMLGLGGLGIVVGLATYGYKVIETLGRKITEITPTRGFSAEFATATTVLIFSKLGVPISTTHTMVGSVIGVGFARGIATLDLRVIRDIIIAWFATIPLSALIAITTYKIILWCTSL